MLADFDVATSCGIEIGALTTPIVGRGEGEIIYVDHTDTESLRRKYRDHTAVDVRRIVEVDAVWGGNTLQQAIGVDRKVDYVLACHVIEHVPDLIGWLQEVKAVLRPGGTLRLIVPDRRFTFDRLRRETRLADIVFAQMVATRIPLAPMLLDHILEVASVDAMAAWRGEIDDDALTRMHTLQMAIDVAQDATRNGTYHDVHCWVFTAETFAALMARAASLGLIGYECVDFHDTETGDIEFFVALRPCDDADAAAASWRRMVDALRAVASTPLAAHDAAPAAEALSDALARVSTERDDAVARLPALEGRAAAVLDALARVSAERDAALAMVAALQRSTSWRITRPLRALAMAARRTARGAIMARD